MVLEKQARQEEDPWDRGGGVIGSGFAGYVPLTSQKPPPYYSLFCGQL